MREGVSEKAGKAEERGGVRGGGAGGYPRCS